MPKPCIKLVGLHIENWRALRSARWPADGMGWNGTVPDIVLLGGVNGTGKTSLLKSTGVAWQVLVGQTKALPMLGSANVWFDYEVTAKEIPTSRMRFLYGDAEFVKANKTESCSCVRTSLNGATMHQSNGAWSLLNQYRDPEQYSKSDFPSVLFLPSERELRIPTVKEKLAGKLTEPSQLFYQLEMARRWEDSLEALLYSARWEDLNAKEEGRDDEATHFASYAAAFQAFFGRSKKLTWSGGELFVEIEDTGERHGLMELSSGEQQVLILMAELHRRWRPGSLILIDEPELHFHATWQTKLLATLTRWQKERGGQVIIATQSNHLFQIAEPDTKILLGTGNL